MTVKIGAVSLGCSKNRVDTELMLGALKGKAEFVADPETADIIIINTCGFIESAKQESIDTILEMAQYGKKLIVTGCLAERYKEELAEALPEVDIFLGVRAYGEIEKAVERVLQGDRYLKFSSFACAADFADRLLTTPAYSAYVRIADGCDNRCSYCAIPLIRGPLASRKIEDIESEVRALVKGGAKEISLIAQDTTKYGLDIYGKEMLSELIDRLAPIEGVEWLRVLYCYPESITEKLIDTMLKYDNVAKYLDIPFQHFDDDILKRMNRRNTRKEAYAAVKMIREKSEDFILRTTVITGFPGETQTQFETLKKAVAELKFDRLGAFAYSEEEGTPAAKMKDQVEKDVREQRRDEIMLLQRGISKESGEKRIGRKYRWLAEGFDKKSGMYFGRTYAEAPETDGMVFVKAGELNVGEFYSITITNALEYDLFGEILI